MTEASHLLQSREIAGKRAATIQTTVATCKLSHAHLLIRSSDVGRRAEHKGKDTDVMKTYRARATSEARPCVEPCPTSHVHPFPEQSEGWHPPQTVRQQ